MFYYFNYTEAGRKGFAELIPDELNHLVKDIEFYKLQNNRYPDSLEQILINNKTAIIDDYLSKKGLVDKEKFQYKKIGDHYTLFSVGMDMIPNTSDDIYPSVVLLRPD